ncbi:MAG: DUF5683 domain-containing protein [Ignavibacteriales bacterium]|nr:DUF5683 domain-containing protein [Ignavibacteriales bacterium]
MKRRLLLLLALMLAGLISAESQDSLGTRIPVAGDASSRKTTAIVYSVFIPGAGQSMLGNTTKGAAFTLSFVGSALTALISHNNYIARGERLDALEYQYTNATNWQSADNIYRGMIGAHDQLKSDKKRRDLFLVAAVAIWAVNIVDLVMNTEDKGQSVFSMLHVAPLTDVACRTVVDPTNQSLFSISIPLP